MRSCLALTMALAVALTACGGGGNPLGEGVQATTAPATAASPPQPPPPVMPPPGPSELPAPAAVEPPAPAAVLTGADVLAAEGFAALRGLRVGLIANQTSRSGGELLLDLLHRAPDVQLVAVFAPEHGVRGTAGAGADVGDTVDPTTGVPIISLYKAGSDFRPTPAELEGVDVLVYDLQDVGTRFYTYIATMGRSMEAAAQAGIPFVVLDRPVPGGGEVIEGFTRTPAQTSFISEYPIPSRYGMTAGELARMIAEEGWKDVAGLDLQIVAMQGWDRAMRWDATGLQWVPPSPGLPTVQSALVYPGTVLVEATTLSFGRGTTAPFTQVGAPGLDADALVADLSARGLGGVAFQATTFTPAVIPDVAEDPEAIRYLGQEIPAVRVIVTDPSAADAVAVGVHLVEASITQLGGGVIDRAATFDLLAGTAQLREMLQAGIPATAIVEAWAGDVEAFAQQRQPYLLY